MSVTHQARCAMVLVVPILIVNSCHDRVHFYGSELAVCPGLRMGLPRDAVRWFLWGQNRTTSISQHVRFRYGTEAGIPS